MDLLWLLWSCSWKVAVVIGAGAAFVRLWPRISAAERRAVWAGIFIAILALPLLALVWRFAPLLPQGSGGGAQRFLSADDGRMVITVFGGESGNAEFGAAALLVLWGAGLSVMLLRLGIGYHRAQRYLLDAQPFPVSIPGWDSCVRVCQSITVPAPLTIGLWRGRILLPADACDWGPAQLHRVLTHEAEHLRCKDPFWKLLASVAVAIFWFHPLVWSAARMFETEREQACDDAVLAAGTQPSQYASDLVMFASNASGKRIPEAAIPMASPVRLEARIVAILDNTKARQPTRRTMKMTYAIALAFLLLPLSALQSRAQAPSNVDFDQEVRRAYDQIRASTADEQRAAIAQGFAPTPESIGRPETREVAQSDGPPSRIRIAGNVQEKKLVKKVQPTYPAEAKSEGVQGMVRLNVRINKEGYVVETEVAESPDERLSNSAVDAVSQWIYETTLLNGQPVEVLTVVDVNFTLSH